MIEVKVLSSANAEKKKIKGKRAKILTPKYVRELNKRIANNLHFNQIGELEEENLQELARKRIFK